MVFKFHSSNLISALTCNVDAAKQPDMIAINKQLADQVRELGYPISLFSRLAGRYGHPLCN
jgi:hypothetical protein